MGCSTVESRPPSAVKQEQNELPLTIRVFSCANILRAKGSSFYVDSQPRAAVPHALTNMLGDLGDSFYVDSQPRAAVPHPFTSIWEMRAV